MSYEYMTGLGAMQPRVGMQQRTGMQKRPGATQQQQQWTQATKERLKASACDGQPCPESAPQRHFFSAMYERNNPDITQQMEGRGCTQQCEQQGVTFYCCPTAQEGMPAGAPIDDPMFDFDAMDTGMDPFLLDPMMDTSLIPVDMTETVTVVEEEKKFPWLLVGVGVLGVGVIGYLLMTRK